MEKTFANRLSPDAEERIQQGVKEAAAVMTLHQLREARSLTQVNLAKVLQINQGAVSKMEKRADMYVSTLRNFIQAMGGAVAGKSHLPRGRGSNRPVRERGRIARLSPGPGTIRLNLCPAS